MDEREDRRAAPLVCVTDGKHHIRKFLREALSDSISLFTNVSKLPT
jgi:hypothetical protein